jgi:hypothetical protein
MPIFESLPISPCLERENRDEAIKNYLKDEPQKPSYRSTMSPTNKYLTKTGGSLIIT